MATQIILPMLGETMNEGVIVEWLKEEGDAVRRGDVLFRVESDKATLEVEASEPGFLRAILAPAGSTVPVLSAVALLTATADEAFGPGPASPSPLPTAALSPAASSTALTAPAAIDIGRTVASPRARRVARERGVDLSAVRGSGPGGRITERDVPASQAAPAANAAGRASPVAARAAAELGVDLRLVAGTGPGGQITRQDVERSAARPKLPDVRPVSRSHRLMAERMSASFSTAPHFYLHTEVDARPLVALRQDLLPQLESQFGVRLTFTDLLVKLTALSLVEHPQVMAQWSGEGLRQIGEVNIGVAADTPHGLIVPVIRHAERLPLGEIARQRLDLTERARQGKLTPQDLELGVFTITNLGMFPVDFFDAILNPPQAAILAVGRIKDRPIASSGQVIVAPMMTLSLAVDHRVLDGAAASRFLGTLVGRIEDPHSALS